MNYEDERVFYGRVVWFNKVGYGFIEWDIDGIPQTDLFVHYSGIVNQDGFRTLKKDQRVSFKIGKNIRNQPVAVDVSGDPTS